MNIEILCVGKTPKPYEQAWIDEYLKRCQRFRSVTLHRNKKFKSKSLLLKESWVIALDEKGDALSTDELAQHIERIERGPKKKIVFLIGDSYGFPEEILARADQKISLTKLTLPHRLALLVLVEQIYRILTVQAGSPYHHS